MYFWGALAFFQITLLPGLIVCRLLGIRRLIPLLIYSFGLSHLFNYLAVYGLTSLGLYNRTVLIAMILSEMIAIGCLYRSAAKNKVLSFLAEEAQSWRIFLRKYRENRLVMFFLVLAVFVLLFPLGELYEAKDSIFTMWDAVVSWNPWALAWAKGLLPQGTGQYPQLLPANWSIAYVLMQNQEVQFFNKASVPLFYLYILLLLLDDGIRHQRPASIFGVVFTYFFISHILKIIAVSGLADLPVAFFSFVCIVTLLQAIERPQTERTWPHLVLAALFCSAAIVTKQAGLFVLLIFPVLAVFVLKRTGALSLYSALRLAALFCAALLLSLPWYIKKEIEIAKKQDSSNVEFVTQGIHEGRSYLERNLKAFSTLNGHLGPAAKFLLIPLLLTACLHWPSLLVLFFHLLPFLFLWASFYSYDTRNLALILPTAGLVLGHGLEECRMRLGQRYYNNAAPRPLRLWHFLLIILTIVLYANSRYKKEYLIKHQIEKQRLAGIPEINYILYSYFMQPNIKKGNILTNYLPLQGVPGLSHLHARMLSGSTAAAVRRDAKKHKADHFFVWGERKLREVARQNNYIPLFSTNAYALYRIPRK